MAAIIGSSEFETFIENDSGAKSGALIDTNLLFAADYDLHHMHEEACNIIDILLERKIPFFANVTIRSELLELKRRVLITESLMDFLKQVGKALPVVLYNKLKSTRTVIDEAVKGERHYLLSDQNIKAYRDLFEENIGPDSWAKFCSTYLKTKLQQEWAEQTARKNIIYLNDSQKDRLVEPLTWEDAVSIIEDFGIGSSDAMIINMFLKSNLLVLCTGDRDVAYCLSRISSSKTVVMPTATRLNR